MANDVRGSVSVGDMTNGERRMANGEWRMANDEWRMANGDCQQAIA